MKKLTVLLSIIVLCSLVIAGCGNSESQSNSNGNQKTRKIKVASFLPTDHPYVKDIVPMWKKKIESAVDNVDIEWVGGPEAVPEDDFFNSIKSRIIDVGFFLGSSARDQVPVGESLVLTSYTPSEERDAGYFDYLVKEYKKSGVEYLGRWSAGAGYYFWTNKKIDSLDDFKGLKIRSNPFYHDIIEKVGATPVNVETEDVYTALERHLVNGFVFPLLGPREDGWTEVTKYLVVNSEFAEQQSVILMNPDTLSQFTNEEQKKLKEATAYFEKDMYKYFQKKNNHEMKAIKNAGVHVIKLSDEDNKKFQKEVNKVLWGNVKDYLGDKQYDKIKDFFSK